MNSSFQMSLKGFVLTFVAVIAFAANSVLCRMALGDKSIDPASFTMIRILSGATFLLLILLFKQVISGESGFARKQLVSASWSLKSWFASLSLLVYAVCFSFAYVSLDTAVGALILFATVQIGLLLVHFYQGNRLNLVEWFGVLITITGFIYLMLPNATAPSLLGGGLMMAAGVAWVFFTVAGKKSEDALQMTTLSFVRCSPFCVLLAIVFVSQIEMTTYGVYLAVLSGGVASGLGYVIWYLALRHITLTIAALSQLCAPVLAAVGGVFLVGEQMTPSLWLASFAIILGIGIVIMGQKAKC